MTYCDAHGIKHCCSAALPTCQWGRNTARPRGLGLTFRGRRLGLVITLRADDLASFGGAAHLHTRCPRVEQSVGGRGFLASARLAGEVGLGVRFGKTLGRFWVWPREIVPALGGTKILARHGGRRWRCAGVSTGVGLAAAGVAADGGGESE